MNQLVIKQRYPYYINFIILIALMFSEKYIFNNFNKNASVGLIIATTMVIIGFWILFCYKEIGEVNENTWYV